MDEISQVGGRKTVQGFLGEKLHFVLDVVLMGNQWRALSRGCILQYLPDFVTMPEVCSARIVACPAEPLR